MVASASLPLKNSAPPKRPSGVHVAFEICALGDCPEFSAPGAVCESKLQCPITLSPDGKLSCAACTPVCCGIEAAAPATARASAARATWSGESATCSATESSPGHPKSIRLNRANPEHEKRDADRHPEGRIGSVIRVPQLALNGKNRV